MAIPGAPAPFLTSPTEICIVTPSLNATISRLMTLGVGPFKTYLFSKDTVSNMHYRGTLAEFELKVAFAQQEMMTWEIMEPVLGPTIMGDYLRSNGGREGVQHIACDFVEGWRDVGVVGGGVVDNAEDYGKVGNNIGLSEESNEVREAKVEAARRKKEFERRGWKCVMGGSWRGLSGTCEFMYFEMRKNSGSDGLMETDGTCFETIVWSKDWSDPEEMKF